MVGCHYSFYSLYFFVFKQLIFTTKSDKGTEKTMHHRSNIDPNKNVFFYFFYIYMQMPFILYHMHFEIRPPIVNFSNLIWVA